MRREVFALLSLVGIEKLLESLDWQIVHSAWDRHHAIILHEAHLISLSHFLGMFGAKA